MAETERRNRNRKSSTLRQESNERRRKREERPSLIGFFLRIAIMFLVFFVVYLGISHSTFKVETFDIQGNRLISDEDIISLSGISVGDTLFQSDVDAAAKQIAMHVMIDDVDVRVRPFHKILIEVTEKNAVALFMDDERYFYVDEKGVVVAETDTPDQSLPVLSGFEPPSFVSIGLEMDDPLLMTDLEIVAAMGDLFKDYQTEVCAVSESENNLKINNVVVHLGSTGRLEEKMVTLDKILHTMSVQKLESLDYIDVSIPDEAVTMEKPLSGTEDAAAENTDNVGDTNGTSTKSKSKTDANQRDTSEAE